MYCAQRVDERLRAVDRRGSRAGRRCRSAARAAAACAVSSIRSLFGPGVRISSRRSRTVGWASATSGRSRREERRRAPWWRAWTRATSVSRSSSAERRFTNVVFALRSVLGQQPEGARQRLVLVADRRRRRCWRCPPAASARRGARRSPPPPCDVSTRKRSKSASSATSSRVSCDVVLSAGLRYCSASRGLRRLAAVAGRPGPAISCCSPRARLRVEGVEELVEVDRRGRVVDADLPAVVDLAARCSGPGASCHVAVGDARQRGGANRRLGARVQRRELVLGHGHLDDRLRPVVELDAVDRADRAGRRRGPGCP